MISYHIIAQHMQQLNSYLRYYKSLSLYTSWYSLYVRGYWKLCVCSQIIRSVLLGTSWEYHTDSKCSKRSIDQVLLATCKSIRIDMFVVMNSRTERTTRTPLQTLEHNTAQQNTTQQNTHTHTHLCITTHTLSHVLTTHDLDAIRAKSITLVFVLVCLFSTFYQIFVCLNYEYSTRSAACI